MISRLRDSSQEQLYIQLGLSLPTSVKKKTAKNKFLEALTWVKIFPCLLPPTRNFSFPCPYPHHSFSRRAHPLQASEPFTKSLQSSPPPSLFFFPSLPRPSPLPCPSNHLPNLPQHVCDPPPQGPGEGIWTNPDFTYLDDR